MERRHSSPLRSPVLWPPKYLLGTSGGAVALSVAALSNFDPCRISGLSARLSSDLYSVPWYPWWSSISTRLLGPLSTVLCPWWWRYPRQVGSGLVGIGSKYGDESRLLSVELWLGTHDLETGKHRLVCSCPREQSGLGTTTPRRHSPTLFLGNRLPELYNAISATSSLSGIVEPSLVTGYTVDDDRGGVDLHHQGYHHLLADGGHECASPLTPLLPLLLEKDVPLGIIYLNRCDPESRDANRYITGSWLVTRLLAASQLHEAEACNEVSQSLAMLRLEARRRGLTLHESEWKRPSARDLDLILTIRDGANLSLLEFYPLVGTSVDMFTASGSDITDLMSAVSYNYGVRVVWAN